MLFSCMFMMASDIFTSMGSMTDSMLNGPSSRSVTSNMASVKTDGEILCYLIVSDRDLQKTEALSCVNAVHLVNS